jgi:hypothetical protein
MNKSSDKSTDMTKFCIFEHKSHILQKSHYHHAYLQKGNI